MCLPSVQEGQTRWEWMKKRDSFTLCEGKGEEHLRIYCQTLKYYLSEASQTLVHIVAAWTIVAFAVIFIMQIPKGDSGEFTLESTTNIMARNRILVSHIITLRNNLCTVRGLCSIMCDFTQGVKSVLSLKKYSIFIQPRFVVACVFFHNYLSPTHTHTKSTTDSYLICVMSSSFIS